MRAVTDVSKGQTDMSYKGELKTHLDSLHFTVRSP